MLLSGLVARGCSTDLEGEGSVCATASRETHLARLATATAENVHIGWTQRACDTAGRANKVLSRARTLECARRDGRSDPTSVTHYKLAADVRRSDGANRAASKVHRHGVRQSPLLPRDVIASSDALIGRDARPNVDAALNLAAMTSNCWRPYHIMASV